MHTAVQMLLLLLLFYFVMMCGLEAPSTGKCYKLQHTFEGKVLEWLFISVYGSVKNI